MSDLEGFLSGSPPRAVETDHYAYSEVFLAELPACHVTAIGSNRPIAFSEAVRYYTQADAFEQFLVDQGLRRTGTPLTWFYHNDRNQPMDPGGNPVREPFVCEVGYEVEDPGRPVSQASKQDGRYFVRPLRALRVASVFYRGSFPHQAHSAFVDAGHTLVVRAVDLGYELSGALYREIYHHLDYSDPSQSVTEIQVELA